MNKIQGFNPTVAMACIFALVLTLVAPTPALARSHKGNMSLGWDNVLRLRHGETVVVQLFSKRMYAGKVESVEPNAIKVSLQKRQGSVLIPREEIKSLVRDEHVKAIEIGVVGAGAGVLLASMSNFIGTTQQIGCLNGVSTTPGLENCSKINHTGLEVAGFSIAGAGIVTAILVGKPKTIYLVDAPPEAEVR
jgi:hypothetical protein